MEPEKNQNDRIFSYSTKNGFSDIDEKKIQLFHVKEDINTAAFFFCFCVLMSGLSSLLMTHLFNWLLSGQINPSGSLMGPNLKTLLKGCSYIIYMGSALLAAKYLTNQDVTPGVWNLRVGQFIPLLIGALSIGIVGSALGEATNRVFGLLQLNYVPAYISYSGVEGMLLLIVVYALFPAILEEYVFRGYLFQHFSKYGENMAIVISSLCFGLVHFTPGGIANAFLFGVFLCYVMLLSRNLLTGMAIHFGYNLFVLFMTLAFQGYHIAPPAYHLIRLLILILGIPCILILQLRSRMTLVVEEDRTSTLFEKLHAAIQTYGFWIAVVVLVFVLITGGISG